MSTTQEVHLPDIGDFDEVDVIEILVSPGDIVAVDDSLVTLESDKATMEIPSPLAGRVVELTVALGDKVGQGGLLARIDTSAAADAPTPETPPEPEASATPEPEDAVPAPAPPPAAPPSPPSEPPPAEVPKSVVPIDDVEGTEVVPVPTELVPAGEQISAHASPSVRRLARELGVDLRLVPGTGPRGRVLEPDVQGYVKGMISKGTAAGVPIAGVAVAAPLKFDFSQHGPTESQPLNRIRKLASANLHRSWVTVPHVTQFSEADITDLDAFRKDMKEEAEGKGVKLTFLPFVLKACCHALAEHPQFNASLDHTGEHLILKRFYNIGVAVDTPNGLVVPTVKNADRKGMYEIAADLMDLSEKARTRKLRPADLQGGSFSISSLGGIGGSFFTPIVNHPEVAILGVGRMEWKPVHQKGEFVPRLMLPLSLSYDHRVIDGADAARFVTRLGALLSDLRKLIL